MARSVSFSDEHRNVFKYIIVGDSGVGKTCLMRQFSESQFDPGHEMTIGVGCQERILQLHDYPKTKIIIWDTAGTEHFRSMALSYFRGAIGAILVYDITRRASFESVAEWLRDAQNHCSHDCVFMLIGNKRDLSDQRQVDRNEARFFSKTNNDILFMETSALSAYNVEEAFATLTVEIHDRIQDGRISLDKHMIPGTGIKPAVEPNSRRRKRDRCCKR